MMTSLLEGLPDRLRGALVRAPHPQNVSPMLATLTKEAFSDPDWLYERKLDGERCIVHRGPEGIRMLSRNNEELGREYPDLVRTFEGQPSDDFVIDGEIVAFEGTQTSFSRLQQRMHVQRPSRDLIERVPAYLYVFDLIYLDGFDTRKMPLRDRKALLRKGFSFGDRMRFTAHRNEHGMNFFEEACGKGWEGLIAKRAGATYTAGRSRDWLKFKCVYEQEFVIGGFTDPQGSRRHLGALLVGYHEDGDLVYAGKVGTGFNDKVLEELHRRMSGIESNAPAFTRGVLPRKGVHWVQPALVGQIGFSEWTTDGQLRHPRFLGLRTDKKPEEVVRERPA